MTKINFVFALFVTAIVFSFSPTVSHAQFGTKPASPGSIKLPTKFDPSAIGYGSTARRPASGELSIAFDYSVKDIVGKKQLNTALRGWNQHVHQLDQEVTDAKAYHGLVESKVSQEALIASLNRLRDAKANRSNFLRICKTKITAQFDGKSVEQKDNLLMRAVELGIVGRTIVFRTNKDGTNKVAVYEGKVNYSKSTDVSEYFQNKTAKK